MNARSDPGLARPEMAGKCLRLLAAATVLASAAGCATNWHLTLMPRDSGKLYYGTAGDTGGYEGPITIAIEDKTYVGTWVQSVPERTSGYVSGGYGGWGRYSGYGAGGFLSIDNPQGGEAKALLAAPDGSGLRCDLRGGQARGGGICRDDRGREYDVQVRPAQAKPSP